MMDCPGKRRLSGLVAVVAVLGAALGAMFGAVLSVKATTTMTGGGTFAGSVALPSFPCSQCVGGGFSGSATLSLVGVGTASVSGVPMPYVGVWPAANASAVFNFDESCLPGQPGATPPPVGSADGTFTVSGGQVTIGGQPLANATLAGTLTWLRAATAARLTLSSLSITAASGGSIIAVNLSDSLQGESPTAFAWTNGPGTCGMTQANQTALIAGIALQPA